MLNFKLLTEIQDVFLVCYTLFLGKFIKYRITRKLTGTSFNANIARWKKMDSADY